MGAGASAASASDAVRGLGPKFEADAKALEDNAITPQMLAEYKAEGNLDDLFDELEITSKIHRKRLSHLCDENMTALSAAAGGAAEVAGDIAAGVAPIAGAAREVALDTAGATAAGLAAAAQGAIATVGPALDALVGNFDAPGAVNVAVRALGGAFATVAKAAVPPIDVLLGPIGAAVGGALKAAEGVRANKEACVSLSVASFTAARTLFESLAMITSDNLARGDFLGARLAPPLQRMQGTLASVESLIGSFAKKGFVKRMLTTDVDARGFARLDKELMAELAEIDAAFGRETLDLQRRTYEHVEQLAHLIESQRAALEAHDAVALAQLQAHAGIDPDAFEEEMSVLGVKIDELSDKVDAIRGVLEEKNLVERTRTRRNELANSLEVAFGRVTFLDAEPIASGTDGAVYRVKFEGDVMVAKVVDFSRVPPSEFSHKITDFQKEVALMASIHSAKVVSVRGCCTKQPGKAPFILMEFADVGSMFDVLAKGHAPPTLLLRLALDAAYGMQALADHGIVHRDLKPAQILVFGGGGGWRTMHAKVADFGRARGTDVTATAAAAGGGFVGSYPWGAPESLESDVYTTMSDVYSFGCILSEILSGKVPFDGMSAMQIGLAVVKGQRPMLPAADTLAPFLRPLVATCEQCWLAEPSGRPTFGEVIVALEQCVDAAPPLSTEGGVVTAAPAAPPPPQESPEAMRKKIEDDVRREFEEKMKREREEDEMRRKKVEDDVRRETEEKLRREHEEDEMRRTIEADVRREHGEKEETKLVGDWVRVFHHDTKATSQWPTKDNFLSVNESDPNAPLFSRLKDLDALRGSGREYVFKLAWPGSSYADQIWAQTSNPTTDETVTGYRAIDAPHKQYNWGGLVKTTSNNCNSVDWSCMKGDQGRSFFYAVALTHGWQGGYPGPESKNGGVPVVQLYVKGDERREDKIEAESMVEIPEMSNSELKPLHWEIVNPNLSLSDDVYVQALHGGHRGGAVGPIITEGTRTFTMVIERGDSGNGGRMVGAGVYLGVADATGHITQHSCGDAWGYYPRSGNVNGVDQAMAGDWKTTTYTVFKNVHEPLNTSGKINGAVVIFTIDMNQRCFFVSVNGSSPVDAGVRLPAAVRPWVQLAAAPDKVRLVTNSGTSAENEPSSPNDHGAAKHESHVGVNKLTREYLDRMGWRLVRRVQRGGSWHPARDHLRGTEAYGPAMAADDADATFSVRFDGDEYDEFLFTTGDLVHWLTCRKDAVFGDFVNEARSVIASSADPQGTRPVRWYNRSGNAEDPWVSLHDHHTDGCASMIYGEARFDLKSHTRLLREHNGANVYIRATERGGGGGGCGSTGSGRMESFGHPIRDKGSCDGWHDFNVVMPSLAFSGDGEVVRWRWFAHNDAGVKFVVYRRVPGDERAFIVVGSNEVATTRGRGAGEQEIPAADRIRVQAGDCIGLRLMHQAAIPFCGDSGAEVIWGEKPGHREPGAGEQLTFPGRGRRDYAVSVDWALCSGGGATKVEKERQAEPSSPPPSPPPPSSQPLLSSSERAVKDEALFNGLCECESEDEAAAARLLAEGADPDGFKDDDGATALIVAAAKGHAATARRLVDAGANVNHADNYRSTPLHVAAREGQAAAARLLLDHGASVNAVTNDRDTPLHCAALSGHAAVARLLLDGGASVNATTTDGDTPLDIAHPEVAALLRERGGR